MVESHSHVRRAKLYFLCDRKGKAARLRGTEVASEKKAAAPVEA